MQQCSVPELSLDVRGEGQCEAVQVSVVDADRLTQMKPEPEFVTSAKILQNIPADILHMRYQPSVLNVQGTFRVFDGADQDVLLEGGLINVVEHKHLIVFEEQRLGMVVVDVAENTRHYRCGIIVCDKFIINSNYY